MSEAPEKLPSSQLDNRIEEFYHKMLRETMVYNAPDCLTPKHKKMFVGAIKGAVRSGFLVVDCEGRYQLGSYWKIPFFLCSVSCDELSEHEDRIDNFILQLVREKEGVQEVRKN